eukprot:tig00021293_g19994.t1
MPQNETPVSCMDVADAAGMLVFSLFRMCGAVQQEFKLVVPAHEPVVYVERTCSNLGLVLGRRSRVLQQTIRILEIAKEMWVQDGRRPQLVCGAAIALALENNPRAAGRAAETDEEEWREAGSAASAAPEGPRLTLTVPQRKQIIAKVCVALGGISPRAVGDRYYELRQAVARVGKEGLPWAESVEGGTVVPHLDAILDFAELRRLARAQEARAAAAAAAAAAAPPEAEDEAEAPPPPPELPSPVPVPVAVAMAVPERNRRRQQELARFEGPPSFQRHCAARERWRRAVETALWRAAGAATEEEVLAFEEGRRWRASSPRGPTPPSSPTSGPSRPPRPRPPRARPAPPPPPSPPRRPFPDAAGGPRPGRGRSPARGSDAGAGGGGGVRGAPQQQQQQPLVQDDALAEGRDGQSSAHEASNSTGPE